MAKIFYVVSSVVKVVNNVVNNVVNVSNNVMCKKKDDYCYRPPTMLRKGNVFSRMCLVCSWGRGSHVTITHDALELTVQGPSSSPGPLTAWTWDLTVQGSHPAPSLSPLGMRPHCTGTPYQKNQVANIGDLFNLVHLRTPPSGGWTDRQNFTTFINMMIL